MDDVDDNNYQIDEENEDNENNTNEDNENNANEDNENNENEDNENDEYDNNDDDQDQTSRAFTSGKYLHDTLFQQLAMFAGNGINYKQTSKLYAADCHSKRSVSHSFR